jgi:hypothetical protein
VAQNFGRHPQIAWEAFLEVGQGVVVAKAWEVEALQHAEEPAEAMAEEPYQ